ncbi:hypothetical protein TVAG_118150 [Trichomonas vaginalis G3]|uniref:Uncharacterized protein n=1 Tax=Trichomonas vaginalis (strain ATCC PRA-98 / G3) TaxID=412133 RepID=A2EI02_TRIV3|nr:hypothetical protein TVAGG3_0230290 [Trichomonas vaginalis G3]EAY07734.1 hypothetical protein TVAG_118150 [Trichomonas vaginalis G3]KAI5552577.1 hypothetical protein TVAGG3_0230290 [Trichomonas vaginalis G3]|eukprot:XP_001319957.1 hypothetical protein [Trichomonas vaginalis G3]
MDTDLLPINEDEWSQWGFLGPPESGFNYSWIHLQDELNFIGNKTTIPHCSLYYSSRKKFLFLVQSSKYKKSLWDITDLEFTFNKDSENFLVINRGISLLHLFSTSTNFIRLLVKIQKIPVNSFIQPEIENNIQYESKKQAVQVKGPTSFSTSNRETGIISDLDVIITKSDEERIRTDGKLAIYDTKIVVTPTKDPRSPITLELNDIEHFQKVTMLCIFFVFYMKDGRCYEISFRDTQESDIEFVYHSIDRLFHSKK